MTSQVEDALVAAVLEAADGRPLAGVGVAAAGFVDSAGERVMFAPHLPMAGASPCATSLPSVSAAWSGLDNDANCAARAEAHHGAARGAASALMITMGTGIGGAVLLDGLVVRGANGMAGEFGHMQVVPDGLACECGRRGCWEQYSSGNALVREARALMVDQPSVLVEMKRRGSGAGDRTDGDLGRRARATSLGGGAFASVGGLARGRRRQPGRGVRPGGGWSSAAASRAAGDRLLDPARAALQRTLVGAKHLVVPPLVAAQLGPQAGMVGAALLASARSAR